MATNGRGFSKHIKQLFNKPELSDVTIILDNDAADSEETKSFYGHRVILATMSDYFRTMFYGSFVEADQREIRLQGVPYTIFKKLMKFVYFGWSDRTELSSLAEAEELYLYARMLLLDTTMKSSFSKWMSAHVRVWQKDLWKLIALALEWEMTKLESVCDSHFREYANEFLAFDSFVESPLKVVHFVVNNYAMNCTGADLNKAVKAWIKHHEDELKAEEIEELNKKVAGKGRVCFYFKDLALYPENDQPKLEEPSSVPWCSEEPPQSIMEAPHEYSYSSKLRVFKCFALRGVTICLKANQQFGPQEGRIKSKLKLRVVVNSTNYAENSSCGRDLTVRYDFSQNDRYPVTIFFPAVSCCDKHEIIFTFKWKGTGVQPLLEDFGPVNNKTVGADSSYVTEIFYEPVEDYGECRECSSDYSHHSSSYSSHSSSYSDDVWKDSDEWSEESDD